jgi:RNA polymerase primary sigma factor
MERIQDEVRAVGYRAGLLEDFEAHRRAAGALRNILIRCNLRLVVSIGKRHVGRVMGLFELVSEGNVCLMRAVECFDYTRGARFATYTTWALTKHYARSVPQANYRLSAQITGQDEMLSALGDHRMDLPAFNEKQDYIRSIIDVALERLLPREKTIIMSRYGLGSKTDGPRTLEEIACVLGVTRERIRQIESRAIEKLRWFVGPDAAETVGA